MVWAPSAPSEILLRLLDDGLSHSQGMLHRNAAVHLRIRRPWRGISEAPFGLGRCNGVGYS